MGELTKEIDCPQKCEIPAGVVLVRVPPPRHAWSDIIRCPDCGDCFLVEKGEAGSQALRSTSSPGGENDR